MVSLKAELSSAVVSVLVGIWGVVALGRPPGRMLVLLILAGSRMICLLHGEWIVWREARLGAANRACEYGEIWLRLAP